MPESSFLFDVILFSCLLNYCSPVLFSCLFKYFSPEHAVWETFFGMWRLHSRTPLFEFLFSFGSRVVWGSLVCGYLLGPSMSAGSCLAHWACSTHEARKDRITHSTKKGDV